MYPMDNNEVLTKNWPGHPASWIDGVLGNVGEGSPGVTNRSAIEKGQLYKYNSSVEIYRCPNEQPTKLAGKAVIRVRNYSMNGQMGGGDSSDPTDTTWVQDPKAKLAPPRKKTTDIKTPGPSQSMVLVHENRLTIEDGYFAVKGFQNIWQNPPSSIHGNGGTLDFADGHAEYWKWRESETSKRNTWDTPGKKPIDRDLIRFQQATAVVD